ncbi:MAG: hypothetical protein ACRDHP_15720 [Ktedonobacterales bacterium]
MPGWQSELEALLSQLHVALEDGRLPPQAAQAPVSTDSLTHHDQTRRMSEGTDISQPWEPDTLQQAEEIPPDGDEVNAVSREIEATVRRVISMARAGRMESALRDDVVFVLQALTRPSPHEKPPKRRRGVEDDASQEWQLASAAAVLRFCRIVLRLTDVLSREAGP